MIVIAPAHLNPPNMLAWQAEVGNRDATFPYVVEMLFREYTALFAQRTLVLLSQPCDCCGLAVNTTSRLRQQYGREAVFVWQFYDSAGCENTPAYIEKGGVRNYIVPLRAPPLCRDLSSERGDSYSCRFATTIEEYLQAVRDTIEFALNELAENHS